MKFTPGDFVNPRFDPVFILAKGNNLLFQEEFPGEPFSLANLPLSNLDMQRAHYIGDYAGQHCYIMQVREEEISSSLPVGRLLWLSLRECLGVIPDENFQMLGRGLQITRWAREHRYCGICGTPTEMALEERCLLCHRCSHRYYPKISPCVICLVTCGDKCLLARHERLPEGMFTTLAGFIEPGETAEQAVKREILEEVNVNVGNLQYFRSQVWPFPAQLMLGFTAEYESGELKPDGKEIIEAQWFDVGDLPLVPPASTISAQLIRTFVERKGKAIRDRH